MRLALFGATGRAGGAIFRQACAAGCEVHALTRSLGKLNRDDPQVTVTAGDVRDLAATGQAVQRADAVVSAIGGRWSRKPSAGTTGRQLTAGGEPSALASDPAGQAEGASP